MGDLLMRHCYNVRIMVEALWEMFLYCLPDLSWVVPYLNISTLTMGLVVGATLLTSIVTVVANWQAAMMQHEVHHKMEQEMREAQEAIKEFDARCINIRRKHQQLMKRVDELA